MRPTRLVRIWCPVLLVFVALGQSACSSNDEDNARIGRSIREADMAIEVASSDNTKEHAAAELTSAREKLIQAQEAARAGRYERAEHLVSESLVNVHLATAKAEAEQVQEQIQASGGAPSNGAPTNEPRSPAGTR